MTLHKVTHKSSSLDEIAKVAEKLGFETLPSIPEALLLKCKTTGEIYWLEVGEKSINRLSNSGLNCVAVNDASGAFELIRGDPNVLRAAKRDLPAALTIG